MSGSNRKAAVIAALLVAIVGATSGYLLAAGNDGEPTALPKGWTTCESPNGYTIAYPEDWFTARLTKAQACMLFDGERFVLEPNSEWPLVDLEVVATGQRFARQIKVLTDPAERRILLRQAATIAGHDALRLKVEVTEHGIFKEGTVIYALVLDRDGEAFVVQTVLEPGTAQAEADERIQVVETAGASLTFD